MATNKYAPEVRERAVRMVLDHERNHASRWAAVELIAAKIGCAAQMLLEWVKAPERPESTPFVFRMAGYVGVRQRQSEAAA